MSAVVPTFVADAVTMFSRDLKHQVRFPLMTVSAIGSAAIFLLLFVYVFGDAIGGGMGLAADAPGGRYVDYLMPGVLVFAIGGIGSATAINLVGDTSTGIVDRFRTMPIAHGSVLTGQFLGSLVRAVVAVVLVLGAGLAVGFRPQADAGDWWVLAGLLLLLTTAVIWIATCFGLMAKTEAGANSSSLLLQFGAFLSSAFVPTASMTAAVAWFAERQPFTAFIDAFRSLLAGEGPGDSAAAAVAWGVGLTLVAYAGAVALFRRR